MANNVEVGPPPGIRPNRSWVRYSTAAIATWLLLSAFVWNHTDPQRVNTWFLGTLMLGVSLVAGAVPRARFVNTGLAVWLFFSTLAFPGYTTTIAHNLIVAVAVFSLSLVPPAKRPGSRPPAPRSAAG